MSSTVYQITWSAYQKNPDKINPVLDKLISDFKGKTAIKTHFGEPGNKNALRGKIIQPVIDYLLDNKFKGFLTDTNTLYVGKRSKSKDHLQTAIKHGFADLGIPVKISQADNSQFKLKSLKNHYKNLPIKLGKQLKEADNIICLSHFKGHVSFGYGGALKNLGMGGASPAGKLILHSQIIPKINHKKCILCQTCIKNCPAGAMSIKDEKVVIDHTKCIGCGECVTVCLQGAVEISGEDSNMCQEKTAVYAYGLVRNKPLLCINYLYNINKVCDCASHTEKVLIPDVGIQISTDPVAIDQASLDWTNQKAKKDLFKVVNGVDYNKILKMGEEIGLGSRKYKIREI
jgi:uncharacterized protein